MLDDLDDFVAACADNSHCFGPGPLRQFRPDGKLYCSNCGAARSVVIDPLYTELRRTSPGMGGLNYADPSTQAIALQIAPALFRMGCVECGARFTAVLHHGPTGVELAVFAVHGGGLSTPYTPPGVSYYLDQAYRAQCIGARSAAVAMYRSALEHLLYEQGYPTGMLGAKIDQLSKDIAAGSAPKWAQELDPAFLGVINGLGNGAIHANAGDITKQAHLDAEVLIGVKEVFEELLDVVYEREKRTAKRLAELTAKADLLKKK